MIFSELEMMFSIKFFEKGSASSYLMIVAQVFEIIFQGVVVDIKLKVSDDRKDRQMMRLVILRDV